MKILEAITLLKNGCILNDEKIRKKLNLSPAELNCIISLDKNEILTCNILSKKMGLSVSRGSRVINKLISRGYLQESKEKSDKRCSRINLSKSGIKVKNEIEIQMDLCEKKILKNLTKKDIENTKLYLEKLIKII